MADESPIYVWAANSSSAEFNPISSCPYTYYSMTIWTLEVESCVARHYGPYNLWSYPSAGFPKSFTVDLQWYMKYAAGWQLLGVMFNVLGFVIIYIDDAEANAFHEAADAQLPSDDSSTMASMRPRRRCLW